MEELAAADVGGVVEMPLRSGCVEVLEPKHTRPRLGCTQAGRRTGTPRRPRGVLRALGSAAARATRSCCSQTTIDSRATGLRTVRLTLSPSRAGTRTRCRRTRLRLRSPRSDAAGPLSGTATASTARTVAGKWRGRKGEAPGRRSSHAEAVVVSQRRGAGPLRGVGAERGCGGTEQAKGASRAATEAESGTRRRRIVDRSSCCCSARDSAAAWSESPRAQSRRRSRRTTQTSEMYSKVRSLGVRVLQGRVRAGKSARERMPSLDERHSPSLPPHSHQHELAPSISFYHHSRCSQYCESGRRVRALLVPSSAPEN